MGGWVREHLNNCQRVLIAGDWHGNYTWVKKKVPYLCRRFGADTIIQLGDFGFTPGTEEFTKLNELLNKNGIRVFFVDGNHEPFPAYRDHPVVEDGFQQLGGNIVRIMRGTVFTLGGIHCLGLGGAGSIDKQFRTPGVDWFPEEYLTGADAHTAISNTRGRRVDVMFTHDAPARIPVPMEHIGFTPDPVAEAACHMNRALLQAVVDEVAPSVLFHGHYHTRYSTAATIRRRITPGFTVADEMRVVGVNKDESYGAGEPGFVFFDTAAYRDNQVICSTITPKHAPPTPAS